MMNKSKLLFLLLQFLLWISIKTIGQTSPFVRDSILPYQFVLAGLYRVEDHPFMSNGKPIPRKINPNAYVINLRGSLIIIDKQPRTIKNLWFSKMFPGFGLHKYKTYKDTLIEESHEAYFVVEEKKKKTDESSSLYYFLMLPDENVLGIKLSGTLPNAEGALRELALFVAQNNGIPDSLVTDPLHLSSFQFVNKEIAVDPSACRWTMPACLQCPNYGEVSWNLFPTETEAQAHIYSQIESNKTSKKANVVSETEVPVLIEGVAINAKKLIYKYKGVVGAFTKLEGSNILTTYYAIAPVRGRWVSCMLSYWGNDWVEKGKNLPPLLDAILQLK